MKIVVLNQGKLHHKYLISRLSEYYEISLIAVEENQLIPPFDTYHPYEKDQELYERDMLLKNTDINLNQISKTINSNNINDSIVLSSIQKIKPDIVLTVGTGLIKPALIKLCPDGFINLHGGDPEYYRGLDSFLWAIYHKDFLKLTVTLHRLNKMLDDGDIIKQGRIKLCNDMQIFQLRSENIKICLDLVTNAISLFNQSGSFISNSQKKKGRYYSFMPSVLKEISVNNFNSFIKNL